MLDPRDRMLLFEALRPPVGFSFDRAVGTTFSLDPTALLAVPLAFAAFDVESEDRAPHDDSLALLEAVRRNARHVSLFCQAGRISVPGRYRSLLTYLEKSVIEVLPSKEGYVFHPKVWLVRYAASDGAVAYRFLCLTRNLTFDRSWDTVLTLDGALVDRVNAFSVNHPLGDFIAALPGLAVRDVPAHAHRDIGLMQDEVRRVSFEPPDGFESLAFLPLGLNGPTTWPFPATSTRGLIVSPFLSPGFLSDAPKARDGVTLVSRLESLDELDAEALARLKDCYYLSEAAEPEASDEAGPVADDSHDAPRPGPPSRPAEAAPGLSGLHAKLFIFDQRGQTTLWTGSANATRNAFGGNVEFLVELHGPRWFCGAEKTLGADDEGGLADLLERYRPRVPDKVDSVQRELERLLDTGRIRVASMPLRLRVEKSTRIAHAWHMTLHRADTEPATVLPPNVTIKAWPISLTGHATPCAWDGEKVADFGDLSLEAVTPFVAFRLRAEAETGESDETVFVVNLPLDGEPPGRDSLVLRELLKKPGDLIALLLLLLAVDELGFMDAIVGSKESDSAGPWRGFGSPGLFEALVKTLAREPNKLRAVKRLVDELRVAEAEARSGDLLRASAESDADAEHLALIPEGFDEIWQPVWEAALELGVADVSRDRDD